MNVFLGVPVRAAVILEYEDGNRQENTIEIRNVDPETGVQLQIDTHTEDRGDGVVVEVQHTALRWRKTTPVSPDPGF